MFEIESLSNLRKVDLDRIVGKTIKGIVTGEGWIVLQFTDGSTFKFSVNINPNINLYEVTKLNNEPLSVGEVFYFDKSPWLSNGHYIRPCEIKFVENDEYIVSQFQVDDLMRKE